MFANLTTVQNIGAGFIIFGAVFLFVILAAFIGIPA